MVVQYVAEKVILFLTGADSVDADADSILPSVQAGQEHELIGGRVTILTYGIGIACLVNIVL